MKQLLLFFTSLFVTISLSAQVTIGALQEPQSGYLLDLKERNGSVSEPDTYNGLGLPKVNLIDLTTLVIDIQDNKSDYVGVMVFNMSRVMDTDKNPAELVMEKGVYIWDGTQWCRLIHAMKRGVEGQVLGSLGDGKSTWRDYFIDAFYKPTFYLGYDANNNLGKKLEFTYGQMTAAKGSLVGSTRTDVKQPATGTFDQAEIYATDFYTKRNTEKIVDLTFSVKYKLNTIRNMFMSKNVWVEFEYFIYINKEINYGSGASFKHRLDFSNLGVTETTLNYALRPPVELPIGKNSLSILVKVRNNTLSQNAGTGSGQFYTGTSPKVFSMEITDMGMVLYEK